jgi:hypothetical protein
MDFDTRRVTMIDADLPAFGEPTIQPDIPAATYIDRVAATKAPGAPPPARPPRPLGLMPSSSTATVSTPPMSPTSPAMIRGSRKPCC